MKSAAVAVRRALFTSIHRKDPKEIPILVRIWHEDGVWNLSAFDLPIVVFDEDLEQARAYFGEAICSHFLTLNERSQLEKTAIRAASTATSNGRKARLFGSKPFSLCRCRLVNCG